MTFDPDRWLEEGRANKHLLPDGVTLPEPEIDYEAWWPALRAYHTSRRWAHDPDVLTDHDKAIIRALIVAYEHAPKAAAAPGCWIEWLAINPYPTWRPDTPVQVRFRDGTTSAGHAPAYVYSWEHGGGPRDIVAYRIVSKEHQPCAD